MSDSNSNELPALKDKDLTSQALLIFFLIVGPATILYVCVTCYCRHKRNQRLAAEKEARRVKYATTTGGIATQVETVQTEQNIMVNVDDIDKDKELNFMSSKANSGGDFGDKAEKALKNQELNPKESSQSPSPKRGERLNQVCATPVTGLHMEENASGEIELRKKDEAV